MHDESSRRVTPEDVIVALMSIDQFITYMGGFGLQDPRWIHRIRQQATKIFELEQSLEELHEELARFKGEPAARSDMAMMVMPMGDDTVMGYNRVGDDEEEE